MIRALVCLFRLRLSILNGVVAAGGAVFSPLPADLYSIVLTACGVALLAAGGSALNQAQEYKLDRMMVRTRQRPVAQGDMKPVTAVLIGGAIVLAGVALVHAVGGALPAMLGAGGIVWYLAVYTPLKRRTPYALIAGALCGALPPVVGWCSNGGDITDYRIILLAGLFYLWQIPHFWLLWERHESDYRQAGIPVIGSRPGLSSRDLLFWLWLISFIAGTMLLPAFNIIGQPAAVWYAVFPVPLILCALMRSRRLLFGYLNIFPLLITVTLFFRT